MNHSTLWASITHQLRESCSNFDHVWMKRRRIFDTFSMTSSLLDLIAGNERNYASVMHRFHNNFGSNPTASSFCEARSKIPSYVLSEINRDLFDHVTDLTEPMDWYGFTPFAMDGSCINLPAKMRNKGFKIVNGFTPSALLTSLVRVSDRMVKTLKLTDEFDERKEAHAILDDLSEQDLVIYDRGYLSFALLTDHIARGVGGLFRVPSGTIFLELQEFMDGAGVDEFMTIDPTEGAYRKAKINHSEFDYGPIEIRAMKYFIGKKPIF